MAKSHVELCRVTTQDGLHLDGALRVPDQRATQLPIDACLLIHGTGSNFTAPGLMETFAHQAVDAGLVSLRVNTRGHDLMARISTNAGMTGPPGSTFSMNAATAGSRSLATVWEA